MSSKRILIADDDELLVKAYSEHLARKGYEVDVSFDGEEALKKIKENPPDLVILDISMPKIDGNEVLDRLKKDPKTKDLPVLVLTNIDTRDDVLKTLKAGATYHMTKVRYALDDVTKHVDALLE
jgi:CheY-like chemotaxis protein